MQVRSIQRQVSDKSKICMKLRAFWSVEGIELPNLKSTWTFEKKRKITSSCEYWKQTSSNKQRWKKKIRKKCLRRTRKLLGNKLCCRNLIKGIEIYEINFVEWAREELIKMTRKLMTMHKVLHARYNITRLYVSRKEEERGLCRNGDSVDALIWWFEKTIMKNKEEVPVV